MGKTISKACTCISYTFSNTTLISGISDIIVVKDDNNYYKSTRLAATFGDKVIDSSQHKIQIKVNGISIDGLIFTLDENGYIYIYPKFIPSQYFSKMGLNQDKNQIEFILGDITTIKCQIHLFNQNDKILISDVDGTLTKSDVVGLIHNIVGKCYLHEGYSHLLQKLQTNKYKIVWVTMRSMCLYQESKKYIFKHTQTQGALLTVPQQFMQAVQKQLAHETVIIKQNLINGIKNIFPQKVNPFIGGLGNRQNDAIAYGKVGIPNIYIIDIKSNIQRLEVEKNENFDNKNQKQNSVPSKKNLNTKTIINLIKTKDNLSYPQLSKDLHMYFSQSQKKNERPSSKNQNSKSQEKLTPNLKKSLSTTSTINTNNTERRLI